MAAISARPSESRREQEQNEKVAAQKRRADRLAKAKEKAGDSVVRTRPGCWRMCPRTDGSVACSWRRVS